MRDQEAQRAQRDKELGERCEQLETSPVGSISFISVASSHPSIDRL
jgi:hypothetical protein